MVPRNSDPFQGLQLVAEHNFSEVRQLCLRDLAGNYYSRLFLNGKWGNVRPIKDFDARVKLAKLYNDLTHWREE